MKYDFHFILRLWYQIFNLTVYEKFHFQYENLRKRNAANWDSGGDNG